jgi:Tfp pilus assembly protein FimT
MDTATTTIARKPLGGRNDGFSLIEILVILVVLAILAGLSGTTLVKWIAEANIKRAARTIVSMCQDARVEAIKRNERMTVNCNNATNTCVVQFTNGTTHRQFDLSTLRSSVRLTDDLNATFTGRGRAALTPPPDLSITMTNDSARSLTVTVRTSGSVVTN